MRIKYPLFGSDASDGILKSAIEAEKRELSGGHCGTY
jgi:hypothetical protein